MFLIVILVLFFAAGVNMGATGKQAVNFNTVATPAQKAAADAARASKAAQSVKAAVAQVKTQTGANIALRHQHPISTSARTGAPPPSRPGWRITASW